MKALYAGSFAPITLGHLDVIEAASQDFEKLFVVIMANPSKNFSNEATAMHIKLLNNVIEQLGASNVVAKDRIKLSQSDKPELTVDIAGELDANILIRGVRTVTNMVEEMELAWNNRTLNPKIRTVWYPVKQGHAHISSSAVRTILTHHMTNDQCCNRLKFYLPRNIIKATVESRAIWR